jgi:hypothetical protein
MMQALNVNPVKTAINSILVSEIVEPMHKQKSKKVEELEAESVASQKNYSFNRFLEAFGDCV